MTVNEWVQILTPIFSGAAGIMFALTAFWSRIKKLTKKNESALLDNARIREELTETKKQLADINLKMGYLVEEKAKNEKK